MINRKQPRPKKSKHPKVWQMVIKDMVERDRIGTKRYGTPLQPFNGRAALIDAYQEALDLAVYLRQVIYECGEMIKEIQVKFKRVSGGRMPAYKSDGAACMDCYARQQVVIAPGCRAKVPLGFCVQIPDGWEGQIRPRSGLSLEGIDIILGTIDSDYRGEICATVKNSTLVEYTISKGVRVAQFTVSPNWRIQLVRGKLTETKRGSQGFGSSGLR